MVLMSMGNEFQRRGPLDENTFKTTNAPLYNFQNS